MFNSQKSELGCDSVLLKSNYSMKFNFAWASIFITSMCVSILATCPSTGFSYFNINNDI